MTPREQAVYDAYQQLAGQLLGASQMLMELPLDEMRTVCTRITFMGALVGRDRTVKIDPQKAIRQGKLIDAAIAFCAAAIEAGNS